MYASDGTEICVNDEHLTPFNVHTTRDRRCFAFALSTLRCLGAISNGKTHKVR